MKRGFWFVVRDIIRKADVVLEVLDARLPEITRHKKLEEHAARFKKPVILVVNKVDLVSRDTINSIKREYSGMDYVLVSSKFADGISDLIKIIKIRIKKADIKAAIVGYPNTGKSSLINRLSKGGRAGTGAASGFTKGLQLIKGKADLILFDTPGVVPFEDRDEVRLGLVAGISPEKLKEPDIVAYELIKLFKKHNPSALSDAYQINPYMEEDEILEEYGKRRNMLKKGGIIDERRAAITFLMDWHKGKIKI